MSEKKCESSFKKLILIGVTVGIISGVGAYLFFKGLEYGTAFVMEYLFGAYLPLEGQTAAEVAAWTPPPVIWLILPIICAGALLSGLIVYFFAPEAEGHGTDAAIRAYHGDGKIRWRVPIVKAVASIITISTGGSAGREGPTAQIAAGFGAFIADIFGAILAAEILYLRDFEADVVMPSFLASIIGYSIFGFFEGYAPIFGTTSIVWSVAQIPLFLILGALAAGVGIFYVKTFYGTKDLFDRFAVRYHIPKYCKPVLGAFLIGLLIIVLSYLSPETMIVGMASLGSGYGFVQLAMYNMLPLSVLILLPFVKTITTSLTIGSGGSGGVFAPGLAVGGFAGGAFGMFLHLILPDLVPLATVPAFVIVGMLALFGGIAHAPIAIMIMVLEMTGDFSLFVPAMGAVAVAYLLIGKQTIFHEQRLCRELPEEYWDGPHTK